MIALTIHKIAEVIKGDLFPSKQTKRFPIKQVITDSRNYFHYNSALFFAIKGVNNDGHRYIEQLIAKGVCAFVVSNPDFISKDADFILVNDSIEALQQLAVYCRTLFQYPVIGITGSKRKTLVKEWLYQLLNGNFKIVRSPKGYNSQIGAPLSVLLMTDEYNLGIFVAGISNVHQMGKLAEIVQPNIGVFTNIGDEHNENFTNYEEKILNKLQLFTRAKQIIYCSDDELLHQLIKKFCRLHSITPVGWSMQNKEAIIYCNVKKIGGSSYISAQTSKGIFNFQIPFTDDAYIETACHSFAVSFIMLQNVSQVTPKFKELEHIVMQLEIKKGVNNSLLINDYYNSDLNSIYIALSALTQQAKENYIKKIVVLSDVKSTGLPQKELYAQVSKLLAQWQIDELIGIGEDIGTFKDLFHLNKTTFYNTTDEFVASLSRKQFKHSAVLLKGSSHFEFEKISNLLQLKAHNTVLEIDIDALIYNLGQFRRLLKPSTKVIAMVKAFSYGSGDVEIAQLMEYIRVDYLAVAVADEAVRLRKAGIETPVIIMNPEQHSFQNIINYKLEVNIYSIGLMHQFIKALNKNGISQFPVHIKIDTGMNRLGLKGDEEIKEMIDILKNNSCVKVKTIFSHLAASDDTNEDDFTQRQIARFEAVHALFQQVFDYEIERHILNSSGIERFPDKQYDYVRLGIGLYGISRTSLSLKPISSLKSIVSQIKRVQPGETVGYNRKEMAKNEMSIAVIPLGYADGVDRKLGNRNGSVYINGALAKIIGNVCMDMLMVDVTGVKVKEGDSVEIFGKHISINEVAKQVETIPYEILTGISQRVKRVYLQK